MCDILRMLQNPNLVTINRWWLWVPVAFGFAIGWGLGRNHERENPEPRQASSGVLDGWP